MTNHPCYLIDDFIKHSHEHLTVGISLKKLERNKYHVYSPFVIRDKAGFEFTFGYDFISDGGSIPWFLWPFLRYNGRAMPAFLIHDMHCDEANKAKSYLIRQTGDGNFFRHLRDCGIPKWIAKAASKAVFKYGEMLRASGKLK